MNTGYHLNSKNRYTPCEAKKRGCRFAGSHITEQTYLALVEQGDIRTKPEPKKIKNAPNYYRKAEEEYHDALQKVNEYDKTVKEFSKEKKQIFAHHGVEEDYRLGQVPTELETNIKKKIVEHYVNAGVNKRKAEYIVEDIIKATPDSFTPIVKNRADRYDPDLKAHTTVGAEAIKNDNDLQAEIRSYAERKETAKKYNKALIESGHKMAERFREKQLNLQRKIYTDDLQKAEHKMEERQNWVSKGIKNVQQIGTITDVTPEKISTSSDGTFNNVWVQHANGDIEKITSYEPPTSNEYGAPSGNLITESGKKLNMTRHYHSFNRGNSVTNSKTKMIIENKHGNDYTNDNWRLYSEIDSSD